MLSSLETSLEERFDCLLFAFSVGCAGGEELLVPGGVADRRDRFEPFEGVLYGVSCGVGKVAAAGPLDSSSVSQTAILGAGLMLTLITMCWSAGSANNDFSRVPQEDRDKYVVHMQA